MNKMKCKYCGCTDDNACSEGCYWVNINLCSKCLDKQVMKTEHRGRNKNLKIRKRVKNLHDIKDKSFVEIAKILKFKSRQLAKYYYDN